jgi:hypothetical protein
MMGMRNCKMGEEKMGWRLGGKGGVGGRGGGGEGE